jgi:hypothetical protein
MSAADADHHHHNSPGLPYFRPTTNGRVNKPIHNFCSILESKHKFDLSVHNKWIAENEENQSKTLYDKSLCRLWGALHIASEDVWKIDGSSKVLEVSETNPVFKVADSSVDTMRNIPVTDVQELMQSPIKKCEELWDMHGNTFLLCNHSKLVEGQYTVKGLSFKRCVHGSELEVYDGLDKERYLRVVNGDHNELEGEFIMGMSVVCKVEQNAEKKAPVQKITTNGRSDDRVRKLDRKNDDKIRRDCAVVCGYSAQNFEHETPHIMVFNSNDPSKNLHLFSGDGERGHGETCPLWYMKLYRNSVIEREEAKGEYECRWRFLGSLKMAQVTAYAVYLADGSIDMVLARSNVLQSSVALRVDGIYPGASFIAPDNNIAALHEEAAFDCSDDDEHNNASEAQGASLGVGPDRYVPEPRHSVFSTTRAYSSWFRPMVRGGD